jgi:CRP-like cAMP-binding protein
MPNTFGAGNQLLARLPAAERERLVAQMTPVSLEFRQSIYRQRAPMEHAYFPSRGAISALTVMSDGSAIEVATIGNEGMAGIGLLVNGDESINEVIVQIAGDALRMDARAFRQEAEADGPLRRLLLRYNLAYLKQISQSVACNGLHPVQQRCCRWLLITLDRMESNVVPLTHEFLAIMLGVRRASVTEVLRPLHEQGLVNNSRGAITILDRAGLEKLACECYRWVRDETERLLSEAK